MHASGRPLEPLHLGPPKVGAIMRRSCVPPTADPLMRYTYSAAQDRQVKFVNVRQLVMAGEPRLLAQRSRVSSRCTCMRCLDTHHL
jgi:hypothetical protein